MWNKRKHSAGKLGEEKTDRFHIDISEAKSFLKIFFSQHEGLIEIRSIRPQRESESQPIVNSFFYRSIADILWEKLKQLNEQGCNIYYGVCTRKQEKGDKSSVYEMFGIWVDVDAKNFGSKQAAWEHIQRTIASTGLEPTLLVDSGNGYHLYFLFNKFEVVESLDSIHKLEGCIKGVEQLFGGDHTHNLDRIMRLPGFNNVKDLLNPKHCKIISFNPQRKYELSDFDSYQVEKNKTKPDTNFEIGEIPDEIPLRFLELLKQDPKLVQTWEGRRTDLNDNSGSGKDMALADALSKYEFTDGETARILMDAPYPKDNDRTEPYLKHTIAKAKDLKKKNSERIKPIDMLTESKKSLHPAMDYVDLKLIYGSSNGGKSFFLHDRKILTRRKMSQKYLIDDLPRRNRFSNSGIKTYLNGAEIRGAKLYHIIHDLLCEYVVFKEPWQPHLITTWIFGTHFHRCFPLYPFLWIQSPTKRCGKTKLLELLSELSFNSDGIQTAPTEAVLFRVPAITAGTLCWDEAENLHNHKEKGERLEILNSAYRKGTKIPRCEGKEYEVTFFEVFRPIAIAGISFLPDTVADRALKVELIRKRKDEKVKRLQIDRLQSELQSLRDGLHIFALERTPVIMEAYSPFRDELIPNSVDDRLRDAFEILISIAGGIFLYDNFKRVLGFLQEAAEALSGIRALDEGDVAFIRAVEILKSRMEANKQQQFILTSDKAVEIFEKGGLEWVKEPEDARKILRKLGFRSDNHRVQGNQLRGYKITFDKVETLFSVMG